MVRDVVALVEVVCSSGVCSDFGELHWAIHVVDCIESRLDQSDVLNIIGQDASGLYLSIVAPFLYCQQLKAVFAVGDKMNQAESEQSTERETFDNGCELSRVFGAFN